ncbi:unnamed protein product [Rotaria magnacalcarata]|uniref:Uncharacterized protein n=1 Tax=Rotaria magnacalcarata TaxID=392030 RepID=A0A816YR88_9BILA|nr:unnamed protein product [Rotaria magnacalcarata]
MIQSSNFRVDTRNLPSISSKYVNARKGEKDEERSNTRRRNICILITAILVLAIMAAVGVVYIVFIRNINAASSVTTTTTGKQYIETTWFYHD